MKSKYNVAIVGCGSMGVERLFDKAIPFTYSFAGAVLKDPRTRLAALVDTNPKQLRKIRSRLKKGGYARGFGTYGSIEEAVDDSGPIDIVCVAAGPRVNADIIRKVRSLGVKGVYCEKPMTLSLAEADELAKIEAKSGLKIQVNYLRNFCTHHLAVLGFIRAGGLGDLLTVRLLYKNGVLSVAPHGFALLNLLFGKPLSVYGQRSPLLNTRCEDDPNIDGFLRCRFKGREVNVGVMATGRGDLENNTYLFEFEFTGTKRRITIFRNGWGFRYERMMRSHISRSSGSTKPFQTSRIPKELEADISREFMIEGLGRLISAIESNTPTNCGAAIARDSEEVAHALAISAEKGEGVRLPLSGAARKHEFKDSVAGVQVLRKETKAGK